MALPISLAPVARALLLEDETLVNQVLEDPAQALLGDLQNVEQARHRHPRIAADEMDDPVVGPSEAELLENRVGVGHEIPVGEEEKLDQRNDVVVAPNPGRNYVSHIDIFFRLCYV